MGTKLIYIFRQHIRVRNENGPGVILKCVTLYFTGVWWRPTWSWNMDKGWYGSRIGSPEVCASESSPRSSLYGCICSHSCWGIYFHHWFLWLLWCNQRECLYVSHSEYKLKFESWILKFRWAFVAFIHIIIMYSIKCPSKHNQCHICKSQGNYKYTKPAIIFKVQMVMFTKIHNICCKI